MTHLSQLGTSNPLHPDHIPTLSADNYFHDAQAAEDVLDVYDFMRAGFDEIEKRLQSVSQDLPEDPIGTYKNYVHDLIGDVFGRRLDDAKEFLEVHYA